MPVRGGVLDAPRSCDSRAALDAFVWRGRPHPRHPRCARHRPQPNVCNPAGAARAPFHTGEPKLSANRGRAGVEDKPLRCGGCGWPACPTAPALPTVRPSRVHHPRIQYRGHSTRTFFTGTPTSFVHPRREGVEALPYGCGKVSGVHPRRRNPSVTALRAATAPLSGEPRGGVRFKHLVRSPTPDGRERAKRTGPRTGPFLR